MLRPAAQEDDVLLEIDGVEISQVQGHIGYIGYIYTS